jgi:hypothetical protein
MSFHEEGTHSYGDGEEGEEGEEGEKMRVTGAVSPEKVGQDPYPQALSIFIHMLWR